MVTSKHVNMVHARQYAKRIYDKTGADARVFLYNDRDTGGLDIMQDWDYYNGPGQGIDEQDVYAMVFYGTGGQESAPVYEVETY